MSALMSSSLAVTGSVFAAVIVPQVTAVQIRRHQETRRQQGNYEQDPWHFNTSETSASLEPSATRAYACGSSARCSRHVAKRSLGSSAVTADGAAYADTG